MNNIDRIMLMQDARQKHKNQMKIKIKLNWVKWKSDGSFNKMHLMQITEEKKRKQTSFTWENEQNNFEEWWITRVTFEVEQRENFLTKESKKDERKKISIYRVHQTNNLNVIISQQHSVPKITKVDIIDLNGYIVRGCLDRKISVFQFNCRRSTEWYWIYVYI